jgi:hypothetical protein
MFHIGTGDISLGYISLVRNFEIFKSAIASCFSRGNDPFLAPKKESRRLSEIKTWSGEPKEGEMVIYHTDGWYTRMGPMISFTFRIRDFTNKLERSSISVKTDLPLPHDSNVTYHPRILGNIKLFDTTEHYAYAWCTVSIMHDIDGTTKLTFSVDQTVDGQLILHTNSTYSTIDQFYTFTYDTNPIDDLCSSL